MNKIIRSTFVTGLLVLTSQFSLAGSATWDLNPSSNDWNTAANWTPDTVPNSPSDTATFDASNTRNISVASNTDVNGIVFDPGASAFTITMIGQGTSPSTLTISGAGVINNSGMPQQLINGAAPSGGVGNISLTGNAILGSSITLTNGLGGVNQDSDFTLTTFNDATSAGNATVINAGGSNSLHPFGGLTRFMGNATAAEGQFICRRAGKQAFAGVTFFQDNSTAANSTFTVEGASVVDGDGAIMGFYDTSSAGSALFTINGSDAEPLGSASVTFFGSSSAGNATLIANSGAIAGGGIAFEDDSTGGTARIEVFGNGGLGITDFLSGTPRTVGSIEGDGQVYLGASNLTVGTNNLSTTFSGVIQDKPSATAGSLTKTGTGTLTLSGANTYTGGTAVNQGALLVSNQIGSGTGTGAVAVTAGSLGGSGTITGPVTIGTGSGTGAFLAPAAGTKVPTRLTTQGTLILNSDSTYTYTFKANSKHARTDMVIANGATINSATLALKGKTQGQMKLGLVLNVINNTSANPISGTFSNLPDDAIVTVNGNNLQASYEGGDGNDLTLTVVP
jgi:autotransporter-associated beta strand protein